MTPIEKAFEQSFETYKRIIDEKVELGGSQVLFIDDSPEMLKLIQIQLELKYGIMQGYLIEPNPVFALHVLRAFSEKDISLGRYIKAAVLDIDYGKYSKEVSVNDLIEILSNHSIPIILFSSLSEDKWKNYVKPCYHDIVKFVQKADSNSLGKVYAIIQERNSYEYIER